MCEQGCEDPWLFFEVKRGSKENSFKNTGLNTWKVLKCVAGEGWRRSDGPIM
jgi:hypothetical protein